MDAPLTDGFNLPLMKLISFQKLGKNRETPRLWLESRRLASLGFAAGTPFSVEQRTNGIRLRPTLLSNNHVSKRIAAKQVRSIIDLANRLLLSPLDGYPEIKVIASYNRIDVTPSVRGFSIQRRLSTKGKNIIAEPARVTAREDTRPTGTLQECCGSQTHAPVRLAQGTDKGRSLRSEVQFRVASKNISALYETVETVAGAPVTQTSRSGRKSTSACDEFKALPENSCVLMVLAHGHQHTVALRPNPGLSSTGPLSGTFNVLVC